MELKLGQDAYYIQNEKIYVVQIIARIVKQTIDGATIKYEIKNYNGKTREVSPAYLVADWDTAKKASIENWNSIVKRVTDEVNNQPYYTFKQAQDKYMKAKEKAENDNK